MKSNALRIYRKGNLANRNFKKTQQQFYSSRKPFKGMSFRQASVRTRQHQSRQPRDMYSLLNKADSLILQPHKWPNQQQTPQQLLSPQLYLSTKLHPHPHPPYSPHLSTKPLLSPRRNHTRQQLRLHLYQLQRVNHIDYSIDAFINQKPQCLIRYRKQYRNMNG